MAVSHVEVEAKYEVEPGLDPAAVLATLVGRGQVASLAPPVTLRLTATYLDTVDLRLAAAGITLRRRTGGQDAGWHLKLPHGADRLEVHRPPGRSATRAPADLVALVRSVVRDRALAPVARIRTVRRVHRLLAEDGSTLVEVADDQVVGEALGEQLTTSGWREVEAELVEGDRRALRRVGKALTAAGAEPAGYASKLRRTLGDTPVAHAPARAVDGERQDHAGAVVLGYLADQVAELLHRDPQVRLDQDDAVHRMRVATRRLRSALATFRPLFEAGAGDPLREELKWLAGELGHARDAEVMREHLLAAVDDLPADLVLGPVQARLDHELRQTYRQAHDRLLAELDGSRYLALLDALDAFLAAPPFSAAADRPAGPELRRLTRRSLRRVEAAMTAAHAPEPIAPDAGPSGAGDARLHEVRKAAKRARYAAEAVAPVVGRPARRFAKQMSVLQETLGDHQDALVAQDRLRELAVQAHLAGENTFTYGLLHGRHSSADADTGTARATADQLLRRTRKAWPA